jgi:integrase
MEVEYLNEIAHISETESRKTLNDIDSYPTPQEIFNELMTSEGWPYKRSMERYLMRDRALVCIMYLAELRVSEAIRLTKDQFKLRQDFILLDAIRLSKRKKGKIAYRTARLPLSGERAPFTEFLMDYLQTLGPDERLFPWSLVEREYDTGRTYTTKDGQVKPIKSFQTVGTKRAWHIVKALLPNITEHWLRAFGEDYLYDAMDHDQLAVADEVKVDPRTLAVYLRNRSRKYKPA